jgi:A/G-specific adenine glycosylase
MAEEGSWPPGRWRSEFRRRLLAWYRRHARDLPWRHTRDPYHVWVSEIMLQQTQVATVEAYFRRFVAALPTIATLAAAPEDVVLRLWEGLGYYRRARQLRRAAQILVAEHEGCFPQDPILVRELPGIGRYTAGAILSIAFDAGEPILEANTVRLLSRLLALRDDPTRAAAQRILWRAAQALLPRRGTGEFNQALMELGSQVCRPRQPDCPNCPVARLCPTGLAGLADKIPPPRRKPLWEEVREAAVIVRRRGRVLLVRRGESERWAGLWDFPRFATILRDHAASLEVAELPSDLATRVLAQTGVAIDRPQQIATLRHGVTRFRITLECFAAEALPVNRPVGRTCTRKVEMCWVTAAELADYPLSSTGRKLAHLAFRGSRSG